VSFARRHTGFLAVAAAGLGLRLALAYLVYPGQGLETDLGFFLSWTRTLTEVGPGAFYASAASANYPPVYPAILWVVGLVAHPLAAITGSSLDHAIVDLLKVPSITADLLIALLLYRAGSRWASQRVGVIAAALYLFIPVTWYDSALWGQVDAVGTLVMLGALLLLVEGWPEAAAAVGALSLLVKPQDAIVLAVIAPVLVRRHLLRAGSGPVPVLGRRMAAVDRALGGLLREQGPVRLGTSAVAAGLAFILPLLPFDIIRFAPASLSDVPVIGHVAGAISLVLSLGSQFSVLTVNAFNAWALVGPSPLASIMGTTGGAWTPDALVVVAGLPAWLFSAILLAAATLLVLVGLLRRDGWVPILGGFALLALAFYLIPTRVHERYLFPFFAPAALLAATAAARVAGYGAVGILNGINIHAVLAAPLTVSFGGSGRFGGGGFGGGGFGGGFGGAGGTVSQISLPFASFARSEVVITAVALGQTAAFVGLLVLWVATVIRPTIPWATGEGAAHPAVPGPTP
jgi:hypothetical protein